MPGKISNNEIESPFRSASSPTCTVHHIHLSFTSIFSLLVYGCEADTHCPSGLSQAFSKQETKSVGGCLPRLSVGCRSRGFSHHIWHKTSFIPTCVKSRFAACQQSKMAELRDRSSVGAVLLIARLSFTGRVVFTVWRVQQDDDSAGKRSSSSRLGEGWRVVSAVTSQQGGTTRQRMTSQRSWTTQQTWLTQHMMMTTQQALLTQHLMMMTQKALLTQHMMMTTREVWSTHHTIRTWQWTA